MMATGRMIIICGRECSEGEDFQELWVNYKDDSECTAQKDAHAHRFSNNPDTRMNFREAAIEMELHRQEAFSAKECVFKLRCEGYQHGQGVIPAGQREGIHGVWGVRAAQVGGLPTRLAACIVERG